MGTPNLRLVHSAPSAPSRIKKTKRTPLEIQLEKQLVDVNDFLAEIVDNMKALREENESLLSDKKELEQALAKAETDMDNLRRELEAELEHSKALTEELESRADGNEALWEAIGNVRSAAITWLGFERPEEALVQYELRRALEDLWFMKEI